MCGSKWLASHPDHFTAQGISPQYPVNIKLGGSAGLDILEKSCPCNDSTPDLPAYSLYYSILANLKLIVTQTLKNLPTFYELPVLPLFFIVALLLKFKNSEGKYLYILGEKQIEHHGGIFVMNRHSKFISVSEVGIILNSEQFSPNESFKIVILSSFST